MEGKTEIVMQSGQCLQTLQAQVSRRQQGFEKLEPFLEVFRHRLSLADVYLALVHINFRP